MTIAEEIDLPLDKVKVTLADARPELVWNQLTGGSNTMHAIYTPVRVAAAIARGALLRGGRDELGVSPVAADDPRRRRHRRPDGRTRHLRPASAKAAASTDDQRCGAAQGRARSSSSSAREQRRVDALDIVTGRKKFAMELDVPNAKPTMVCRPPTINGTARSVGTSPQVKAMPGVTDVAIIPHTQSWPGGVAVRGETFGQCIDAIRALDVDWAPGTADGKSDASVLADLRRPSSRCRRRSTCSRRRSTSSSRSTSARATRWRRTPPSPTCAPTAPRSGRA